MECTAHQVTAKDGTPIAFHAYREPHREAALVVCPGFFQSKETPTFRRLAATLAGLCDVLCMDFRGHGRSGGFFTFSSNEQQDLDAVLQWAQQHYARIAVIGFSMGAATAIHLVGRRDWIRALIAVSAPAAFEEIEFRFWTPDAIETGFRGLEPGAGCRLGSPWLAKERPIDTVQRVAPIPLLLIHGTKDSTIAAGHSERLYQAAGEPKRLVLMEGGGHAQDLYRCHPDRFLALIKDWLTTTLLQRAEGSEEIQRTADYVDVRGGVSLYRQRWTAPHAKASVVIVHGIGEHSGRYEGTASELVKAGYEVTAFDLPGHGRSPGRRGHIRRFQDYTEAVGAVVRRVTQDTPGRPLVLLGHSMGGLIATWYAIAHPHTIAALVLTSPLWGYTIPIPWWERLSAHGASPVWPSLTFERPHSSDDVLSHDPEVERAYVADPLVHFKCSVRLYTELQRRIKQLPRGLPQLRVPLLVLQAGEDRLCSAEATSRLFPYVGASQKHLTVYEGYYHEVLNEVWKDHVVQELVAWLQRTLGAEATRG